MARIAPHLIDLSFSFGEVVAGDALQGGLLAGEGAATAPSRCLVLLGVSLCGLPPNLYIDGANAVLAWVGRAQVTGSFWNLSDYVEFFAGGDGAALEATGSGDALKVLLVISKLVWQALRRVGILKTVLGVLVTLPRLVTVLPPIVGGRSEGLFR